MLLVRWPSPWLLLEQWWLISSSIWWQILGCIHLYWRTWLIVLVLQSLLFLNGLSTFSWVHLILSQHVIILSQGTLSLYLFSLKISISLMLSQPSFNFRAVHGYVYFSSLPFWCLMHHTCYASILCTAYLISAPTAQGLGFALCT